MYAFYKICQILQYHIKHAVNSFRIMRSIRFDMILLHNGTFLSFLSYLIFYSEAHHYLESFKLFGRVGILIRFPYTPFNVSFPYTYHHIQSTLT